MTKYEVDPIGEARRYWRVTKEKDVEEAQRKDMDALKKADVGDRVCEVVSLGGGFGKLHHCKPAQPLYDRIEQLEQLCRDLFRGCEWQQEVEVSQVDWDTFVEEMQERMDALGLLGVEE